MGLKRECSSLAILCNDIIACSNLTEYETSDGKNKKNQKMKKIKKEITEKEWCGVELNKYSIFVRDNIQR